MFAVKPFSPSYDADFPSLYKSKEMEESKYPHEVSLSIVCILMDETPNSGYCRYLVADLCIYDKTGQTYGGDLLHSDCFVILHPREKDGDNLQTTHFYKIDDIEVRRMHFIRGAGFDWGYMQIPNKNSVLNNWRDMLNDFLPNKPDLADKTNKNYRKLVNELKVEFNRWIQLAKDV